MGAQWNVPFYSFDFLCCGIYLVSNIERLECTKKKWHRFLTEIILDSWTSFLSFTYFGMTGGGISYCDAFTCMAMHNILGFHTDEFSCMVFFIYIYSVCPVLFILEKSSSLSVSEYPFLFVVFDLSSMTLQWERVWLCNVARNDRELERL